ncbi:uncharacterized protein LOC126585340 isoform X2 [Malus sylvestris]|uniref:uncharacterized protein LOC126585340 isoform X2 n=1 Tax=Malus sylvestris TaxID=3752 RepID=UPI0021AD3DBA|nr:uncharacterized protein LOC126585340 isoform X2 [Malus sylvestris]
MELYGRSPAGNGSNQEWSPAARETGLEGPKCKISLNLFHPADRLFQSALFFTARSCQKKRERNIRPDPEIDAFMKSLQLGCAYVCSICCPKTWDHVYLFDNDYDDAEDMYGKSMRCRFPYDQRGRLILEDLFYIED